MKSSMNPSISIVIPLYNGAAFIAACLNAVLPQVRAHGAAEVIVVDNASTDDCDQALAPFSDAIRRHRLPFNTGFAAAANTGIQLSQSRIIALLNQDAIAQAGWLDALLARFEASPRVGIVGSKCVRADGALDHAGGVIHRPLFYTTHIGIGEPDLAQYNQPCQRDYVTGAALAVHRMLIERAGWFDQGFYPAYYEETDLCLRAREAGFEVWYEPDAVVLHQSSQTPLEQMSVDRIATFHRNRLRCLVKHTEPAQIGSVLRGAEMAEIESPQASGLLTGRAIAYRDTLRGILDGDPILSSRVMPDGIDALAQCYRQAYRRAEQAFDDTLLPLSRRIEMTPRADTWQDLQRGFEDMLQNLMQLSQNIEALLRESADKQAVSLPPDTTALSEPEQPTGDQAAPQSAESASVQAGSGESALQEVQSHQAMLLDLHRKMGEIDSRLAQLADMGSGAPPPALPDSRLEWLRETWRGIRALPVLAASVRNLEREARVNTARVTSLIGETRGIAGYVSEELVAQGRHAGRIATDIEHAPISLSTQQRALTQLADAVYAQRHALTQQDAHLAGALTAMVSATRTVCQFLHECITWQADVTRRLDQLRRHTSAMTESETTVAVIQALQSSQTTATGTGTDTDTST